MFRRVLITIMPLAGANITVLSMELKKIHFVHTY